MTNTSNKVTKILFVLVSALVLSLFAINLYTFYFQKDYDFTVEVPCGEGELCFIRHCGEVDECPPNELERYRMFVLNASDYDKCENGVCLNACTSGSIECEEVICDESVGDACVASGFAEE